MVHRDSVTKSAKNDEQIDFCEKRLAIRKTHISVEHDPPSFELSVVPACGFEMR